MKRILMCLLLNPVFLLAHDKEENNEELQLNKGGTFNDVEILYQKFWSLDSDGMPSSSDPNEFFGTSVTQGYFNDDGFQDIAIGIPGYAGNIGAVTVMYGTASGLSADNSTLLFQAEPVAGDAFGYSLTVGDLNGDFIDDLIVGTPFEDVGTKVDAGVINVFYGSSSGLSGGHSVELDAGLAFITPEAESNFGWSLAAGYFNDDNFEDLAVSIPNATLSVGNPAVSMDDAGVVRIYYGSANGIDPTDITTITQETTGIFGGSEAGDKFGYSLVAGDFNRQPPLKVVNGPNRLNHDDLAIGVPFESYGATANGVVYVLAGGINGLTPSQFLSQENTSDPREDNDLFGFTLATGDINNIDGPDELFVGVPYEDIGSATDAGIVHVFYGSACCLTDTGTQIISQNSPGIFGVAEIGDLFGLAMTVGDINQYTEGFFIPGNDLLIAAPYEDYLATDDGFLTVVFGGSTSLDTNNSTYYSNSNASNNTNYGLSLTLAQTFSYFNSFNSLVVGVPGQTSDGNAAAGAIEVIAFDHYDIIFRDGLEQ